MVGGGQKNGKIQRFDGVTTKTWPISTPVKGIWGASESAVFAVGNEGLILRFDGTRWSQQASGTTVDLVTVWGNSATEVFAAGPRYVAKGESGVVLYFDGTSWSEKLAKKEIGFTGVWGASATEVYASYHTHLPALRGGLYRFDGSTWSEVLAGPTAGFFAVGGAGPGKSVVVGGLGSVVHSPGW